MSLSTRIAVSVQATLDNAGTGIVTAAAPLNFAKNYTWADGVLINTANRIYMSRLTLSTTPTDLDLSGSLLDVLGAALVFAKITGIIVQNRSTTIGENVTIGGDAAGLVGWVGANTHTNILGPDGLLAVINPSLAGYAVTGTTADILQIVAAAGTPAADVIIIGRSA